LNTQNIRQTQNVLLPRRIDIHDRVHGRHGSVWIAEHWENIGQGWGAARAQQRKGTHRAHLSGEDKVVGAEELGQEGILDGERPQRSLEEPLLTTKHAYQQWKRLGPKLRNGLHCLGVGWRIPDAWIGRHFRTVENESTSIETS